MEAAELFGRNVKRYRIKRGITQEQLALDSDLDMSYISEVENGHWNVTIKTAIKIARTLGVSLIDLLDGIE